MTEKGEVNQAMKVFVSYLKSLADISIY